MYQLLITIYLLFVQALLCLVMLQQCNSELNVYNLLFVTSFSIEK